jgi:MYXO-CTERM domain-containing protein
VDLADVTPLTPVEIVDEGAPAGTELYYAVYAFDGERWLETTSEGLNADLGSRLGDPDVDEALGKCGCQSAGAPTWGALAAIGGLLLRRRRRG